MRMDGRRTQLDILSRSEVIMICWMKSCSLAVKMLLLLPLLLPWPPAREAWGGAIGRRAGVDAVWREVRLVLLGG